MKAEVHGVIIRKTATDIVSRRVMVYNSLKFVFKPPFLLFGETNIIKGAI